MYSTLKSSTLIVLSGVLGLFAMGASSCSEPKEYCKFYGARPDQAECTTYCEKYADFEVSPDRANLVKACQLGQMGYLSNVRVSAAEALLGCDRHFESNADYDKACRVGVAAEELRVSRSPNGPGTSDDRETGNGR